MILPIYGQVDSHSNPGKWAGNEGQSLCKIRNRDLESFAGDPQRGSLTPVSAEAVTWRWRSKPRQAVGEIFWGRAVSLALLKSHLGKQLPTGPGCQACPGWAWDPAVPESYLDRGNSPIWLCSPWGGLDTVHQSLLQLNSFPVLVQESYRATERKCGPLAWDNAGGDRE